MAKWQTEAYENKTDEWPTPQSLVRPLADAVGGFDLDPASGAESVPHAGEQYTQEDDGLHQSWFGAVWCNPPFSDKKKWLKKAIGQVNEGNADTVVMLLPVDTSTYWYHDLVTQSAAVCFMGPGRTEMAGSNGSPNFNFMLVVFGDVPSSLLGALHEKGIVYYHRGLYSEGQQVTLL